MAKSTPSRTKPTPTKPSTPAPAPASADKAASASQKRVRVVDDHAAPSPSKKTKGQGTATTPSGKKDAQVTVGGNGVERKDLREKRPGEVEAIRSKDAPAPHKGALKKGKGKKVEVAAEADEEIKLGGGEAASEDDDDEEADIDFLAGFESGEDDGEDSSDEEAEAEDAAGVKPVKADQLPQVKGAPVQKKLEAKEKKQVRLSLSLCVWGLSYTSAATDAGIARRAQHKTGTVYLGRIPKGFYEDEMRSYFSQFGEVTRLRLSRNKQVRLSLLLWRRRASSTASAH